ncbi:MAG: CoA-binding protein [Bacteroidia bacterium]|nr:CoA-binding protein [Bacteroidia bacterium]
MNKKTLVIGASNNPDRFSYKAVRKLKASGYEAIPIGIREGEIEGIKIHLGYPEIKDVHTITIYINPSIQPVYYDYILKLKPIRVIFNPGTENEELKQLCKQNEIEVVEYCTLIMLSSDEY